MCSNVAPTTLTQYDRKCKEVYLPYLYEECSNNNIDRSRVSTLMNARALVDVIDSPPRLPGVISHRPFPSTIRGIGKQV